MTNILRIDLTAKKCVKEELPEKYQLLGGRGLSSGIIADEVSPNCDPLGKYNKIVISCGLLAGTGASSTNRVSIGTKSPLTGGIKEANAGGMTAYNMARLGYRALILQGSALPGKPQIIIVDENGASLEDAGELWGLGTYSAMEKLWKRFGKNSAYVLIGPAGEMRMNLAGIAHTDMEGRPTRYSARGGVGAVMGSMGIKAIVIPGKQGAKFYGKDDSLWKDAFKRFTKTIQATPATAETMPQFGTALTMEKMHGLAGLPVNNFRCGQLENIETFGGKKLREIILERGGEGSTTHGCMPGCIVCCSNIFPNAQGKEINAAMEFENLAMLGSNLMILDIDNVNALNYICNDLGIDTIETGCVLAVAAGQGLAEFGNFKSMEKLLKEISSATPLGRLLGLGAAAFAKAYGCTRSLSAKGQAISAYDPRTMKANGVTFLTSPMGADHTAGNSVHQPIDHPNPEGKVQESYNLQVIAAWIDTLGLCIFLRSVYFGDPSALHDAMKARFGGEWTQETLSKIGRETLRTEILFNRKAGIPDISCFEDFVSDEPLPPLNTVWEINQEELQNIWAPLFS